MGTGVPRFGKNNLGKGSGGRPHGPPVGDRAGAGRVAGREQDQELMSSQLLGAARRGRRPPGKAPLGEPLVAQPEPLAVVHQHLQRRPFAVAKDEDGAGEGTQHVKFYKQAEIDGEPCYLKFTDPSAIKLLVAGGAAGKFSAVIGSWAAGPRGSQMVTYPIEK